MAKVGLWLSTYKEECAKVLTEPNDRVVECLELSEDDDVAITVATRKDGPAMNGKDLACVATTLRAYPLVHTLTLTHHGFDAGSMGPLAELLVNDSALSMLELRYCDIGPAAAATLCRALAKNTALRVLDLSGNPIGFEGGFAAAEMLQSNGALLSLSLDDAEIETEAVVALATALRANATLTALSISNPRLHSLEDETIAHVADMLAHNSTLVSLDVSKNRMSTRGLHHICVALLAPRDQPSALRSLSLRCNPLGGEAGPMLGQLLTQAPQLDMLNASACRLGDDGAHALSRALEERAPAISLDLSYNDISSNGLCALANALAAGASVQELHLWGNRFDGRAAAAMAAALDQAPAETDFIVHQPEAGRYTVARAH